MTLVPNETEQALNRQYDVYAAAREEYRKKISEQAAEIERLRAALRMLHDEMDEYQRINNLSAYNNQVMRQARAARGGEGMTREELREKVAMAIAEAYYRDLSDGEYGVADLGEAKEWFPEADAAIAIVLDEAAKVALDEKRYGTMSVSESLVRFSVSAAIRALKG